MINETKKTSPSPNFVQQGWGKARDLVYMSQIWNLAMWGEQSNWLPGGLKERPMLFGPLIRRHPKNGMIDQKNPAMVIKLKPHEKPYPIEDKIWRQAFEPSHGHQWRLDPDYPMKIVLFFEHHKGDFTIIVGSFHLLFLLAQEKFPIINLSKLSLHTLSQAWNAFYRESYQIEEYKDLFTADPTEIPYQLHSTINVRPKQVKILAQALIKHCNPLGTLIPTAIPKILPVMPFIGEKLSSIPSEDQGSSPNIQTVFPFVEEVWKFKPRGDKPPKWSPVFFKTQEMYALYSQWQSRLQSGEQQSMVFVQEMVDYVDYYYLNRRGSCPAPSDLMEPLISSTLDPSCFDNKGIRSIIGEFKPNTHYGDIPAQFQKYYRTQNPSFTPGNTPSLTLVEKALETYLFVDDKTQERLLVKVKNRQAALQGYGANLDTLVSLFNTSADHAQPFRFFEFYPKVMVVEHHPARLVKLLKEWVGDASDFQEIIQKFAYYRNTAKLDVDLWFADIWEDPYLLFKYWMGAPAFENIIGHWYYDPEDETYCPSFQSPQEKKRFIQANLDRLNRVLEEADGDGWDYEEDYDLEEDNADDDESEGEDDFDGYYDDSGA